MENIIFRYNYWLRFLRNLKRELRRLQESTSLITQWNHNTIYDNTQTRVTYTGPEEHGALTALEKIASEDPLSVHL
ncbi:hypothetical protein AnigIFM60653_006554 [Aspergillus niger]|nr:hypothetical protein AnigIFM60653_006554 [Aspergillus niger]